MNVAKMEDSWSLLYLSRSEGGKFMKKFLLLFVIFLFTITDANAVTTTVRYNNAGVPIRITRGYGRPAGINNLERHNYYTRRARPAMPATPALPYGYRTRHAHNNPPPPLVNYNFPAPVQSANVPKSRLDKNFNAVVPQKSYTMNGVTYYN